MSEEKQAPKLLLMWSGGISSTAILFHLLSSKDYMEYDVVVHHCHIIDIQNKAPAEAKACADVLAYVESKKKYRQFFFSESSHNFSFLRPPRYNRGIHEFDTVMYVASQIVAADSSIDYVVLGGTATDTEKLPQYTDLHDRAQRIFTEALSMEESECEVEVDFPFGQYTLGQAFNAIPKPVRKKLWSCKVPRHDDDGTNPTPCGGCSKCKLRETVGI